MTVVTETLVDPAGDPIEAGISIRLRRQGRDVIGYVPSTDETISNAITRSTDPDTGVWSADLVGNDLIVPDDTYWHIERTNCYPQFTDIIVPSAGGPYSPMEILADPYPSSLSAAELLVPASGLIRGRRKMAKQEQVFVDPAEVLVLLDVDGAGTVDHIWSAVAFNSTPQDVTLRVYVDGEVSPAIDVDLGALLAIEHPVPVGFTMWCEHAFVEGQDSGSTGFVLRLPMSYSNGIRVEMVNTTPALVVLYTMVSYTEDVASQYRLRSASVKGLSPVVVPAANEYTYLDVEGQGFLAWHGLTVSCTTGIFIERNHGCFIDGEVSPSFLSSGTEDWQGGTFTHQGRQYVGMPYKLLGRNETVASPNLLSVATDLIALYGGVYFSESLEFRMLTEAAVNQPSTISHATLYYLAV